MRKALTGAGALAALLVFVTAGGAVPFAGTIEASDPTQGQPIFLNGVASTCATPKGPQGSQGPAGGTTHHYDSYSFVNTTGSTQCVTVTLSQSGGTGSLQTAAYSGSFNPDEPWMNLLADPGEHTTGAGDSVSFSFTVAPGAAYVLVVHEAIANGCLGCTYTGEVTSVDTSGLTFRIEASDPTQGQPIFLNGVASTCTTPKGPQGSQGPAGGTTYHYDSYSFVNTTGLTQCVTVTLSQSGGTGSLQTAAYSGSFNPAEPWMNLLADPGENTTGAGDSVSFSFTVAPGAAYVLVVHEAIANGCLGCTYTLNFGSSVLPAALRSATALRTAKGVLVRWRTGAEPELLGFHLYRLRAGSYSRLTRALLPARGTVAGAAYRYLDRAAPRKGVLRYRLQRVDVDGSRTWLGSVLKVRR